MDIFKFLRKTKLFTLIELIVVIVVLGILAAIVVPNISSFKDEADHKAILSNVRNIQTAVDMFSLENHGATPTKDIPTLGNPQTVEVFALKPDYLRETPKVKGVKYWLDQNNTVWASTVDAPTKVEYKSGKLIWETVDGAELYKIYKSEDSTTASVKNPKGIKYVDELIPQTNVVPEKILPELSQGTYLVTAVDRFDFESAPTKAETLYQKYEEPDKDFTFGFEKTPVTTGPQPLLKEVPVGWIGIDSADELAKIGVDSNYPLNGKYILMKSLDLNIAPYNEGIGWKPIGNGISNNYFRGKFDGNGLEINNLYINTTARYSGLFGYTAMEGEFSEIKNLTLKNAKITAKDTAGILVGFNGYTNITNVKVQGEVKGEVNVGGLAGQNWNSGLITYSSSDAKVVGRHNVGGFVGENIGGYIRYSHSSGYVESTQYNAGGFIGHMSWNRPVENSYSTATVKGVDGAGGFIGQMWSSAVVKNSYSTGAVTGNTNVGGFIGYHSNNISVSSSYWDVDTSKLSYSAAGSGKTTNQMFSQNTFSSWDFANTWVIDEGSNYPVLK